MNNSAQKQMPEDSLEVSALILVVDRIEGH